MNQPGLNQPINWSISVSNKKAARMATGYRGAGLGAMAVGDRVVRATGEGGEGEQ